MMFTCTVENGEYNHRKDCYWRVLFVLCLSELGPIEDDLIFRNKVRVVHVLLYGILLIAGDSYIFTNRISIIRTQISRIPQSSKRLYDSKIHFDCFLQP